MGAAQIAHSPPRNLNAGTRKRVGGGEWSASPGICSRISQTTKCPQWCRQSARIKKDRRIGEVEPLASGPLPVGAEGDLAATQRHLTRVAAGLWAGGRDGTAGLGEQGMGFDIKAAADGIVAVVSQNYPYLLAGLILLLVFGNHRVRDGLHKAFTDNWQLTLLASTGIALSLASAYITFDGLRNFTSAPL